MYILMLILIYYDAVPCIFTYISCNITAKL